MTSSLDLTSELPCVFSVVLRQVQCDSHAAVRIDDKGYAEVYRDKENLAPWNSPALWRDPTMGDAMALASIGSDGRFCLTLASAKTGMLLVARIIREGDFARQVRFYPYARLLTIPNIVCTSSRRRCKSHSPTRGAVGAGP